MPLPPLKQLISELEIALAAETRPTMTRVLHIFPVESRFVSTAHVLTEEPRRAIVAWPKVSHPAVVEAWLGEGSVAWDDGWAYYDDHDPQLPGIRWAMPWPDDCDCTLADPEAAGWALAAARAIRRDLDAAELQAELDRLRADAPDDECERYVRAVCEGVRG